MCSVQSIEVCASVVQSFQVPLPGEEDSITSSWCLVQFLINFHSALITQKWTVKPRITRGLYCIFIIKTSVRHWNFLLELTSATEKPDKQRQQNCCFRIKKSLHLRRKNMLALHFFKKLCLHWWFFMIDWKITACVVCSYISVRHTCKLSYVFCVNIQSGYL